MDYKKAWADLQQALDEKIAKLSRAAEIAAYNGNSYPYEQELSIYNGFKEMMREALEPEMDDRDLLGKEVEEESEKEL